MTSPQFVDFLEAKLAEHGVGKVIPQRSRRSRTCTACSSAASAPGRRREALAANDGRRSPRPADLEERVRAYLAKHPEASWDQAVATILAKGRRK